MDFLCAFEYFCISYACIGLKKPQRVSSTITFHFSTEKIEIDFLLWWLDMRGGVVSEVSKT